MTTCSACEKPLSNGLDTYGDAHCPLCQTCWLELSDLHGYDYMHIIECGTCRRNFLNRIKPIISVTEVTTQK